MEMEIEYETIVDLMNMADQKSKISAKTREWLRGAFEQVAGEKSMLIHEIHHDTLWIDSNGIKSCGEEHIKALFKKIYLLYELEVSENA